MFNKKYKKGMADAAKAYEALGEKQSDAIKRVLEEIRQLKGDFAEANDRLNMNFDGIYNYLDSKEKAELYHVYTPFDIIDLGDEEALFLVGALFRLAEDRAPNEHQQDYLRSIQHYLGIKEPPMGVDPLDVEEIEAFSYQKAIFQTVVEYLRLQDGDSYDETELQQAFLDAFNLSPKNRQAIFEFVEMLYTFTGYKGLTEKYGYKGDGQTSSVEQNELIQNLENALKDLAKSKSTCPNIIHVNTSDFVKYEEFVMSGLEGESYATKSYCESEAERCLNMYYDKAESDMRQVLDPAYEYGIYYFFKINFDKAYSQVIEAIRSLHSPSNNQVLGKINSFLDASKIYDDAKEILSNLKYDCSLPFVSKYTSLIEYDVDDPSEFEEGFMKFLAKIGKTYGYDFLSAKDEINEDIEYKLTSIIDKFNDQIQECIFTAIVDPINKLIPQLAKK